MWEMCAPGTTRRCPRQATGRQVSRERNAGSRPALPVMLAGIWLGLVITVLLRMTTPPPVVSGGCFIQKLFSMRYGSHMVSPPQLRCRRVHSIGLLYKALPLMVTNLAPLSVYTPLELDWPFSSWMTLPVIFNPLVNEL